MVFVFQLQAPFRPITKSNESQSPQAAQEKFKEYDIPRLRNVILNSVYSEDRKAAAYEYASRVAYKEKEQRKEAIRFLLGKAADIADFNPQYFLNKNNDGMYLLALAYKLAEGDFDLSSIVEDQIKSIGNIIKSKRVRGAPDSNQFVGSVKELAGSIPSFPLPQVSQETQTQKEENKAVAGVGGESSNLTAEVKSPSNLQQQKIEGSTNYNTGVIEWPRSDPNWFNKNATIYTTDYTPPMPGSDLINILFPPDKYKDNPQKLKELVDEWTNNKWNKWWNSFPKNHGKIDPQLAKEFFDLLGGKDGNYFADNLYWGDRDPNTGVSRQREKALEYLNNGDVIGFLKLVHPGNQNYPLNITNPLQYVLSQKYMLLPYTENTNLLIGKVTIFYSPSKEPWSVRLNQTEGFSIYLDGFYLSTFFYDAILKAGVGALNLQFDNLFGYENKELANLIRTYFEIVLGGSFLIYTGPINFFVTPFLSVAPDVPGIEITKQDILKQNYPNIGDSKKFYNVTTSSKLGAGLFLNIVNQNTGIAIFPPQWGNLFIDGGAGFMKEAGGPLRFLWDFWLRYKIDLSKGVDYWVFLIQINPTGQINVGQEPQYALLFVPAVQWRRGNGWGANLNLKGGHNFNLHSTQVGAEVGVDSPGNVSLFVGYTLNINNQYQNLLPKYQFRIGLNIRGH